jgi:DNA-binding NarL/FixJ family response regulator
VLRRLCEFDCDVVGCFPDGASLLTAAPYLAPDVAVVDLQMPGPNGLDVCRQLKTIMPEIRVVIITAYGSDELMMDASTAGVDAFVSKFALGTDLIPAIIADGRK